MDRVDRYTCEQVFQRLDDYVDRELTEREMELIREHLAICEWCASTYRFQDGMLQELKTKLRRVPSVAPDLMSRIHRALEKAQADPSASEGEAG